MDKDHKNFYEPGLPWIIVQKLTKDIIEEAIMAYFHDCPKTVIEKAIHAYAEDNGFQNPV